MRRRASFDISILIIACTVVAGCDGSAFKDQAGGATPEEVVRKVIAARTAGDVPEMARHAVPDVRGLFYVSTLLALMEAVPDFPNADTISVMSRHGINANNRAELQKYDTMSPEQQLALIKDVFDLAKKYVPDAGIPPDLAPAEQWQLDKLSFEITEDRAVARNSVTGKVDVVLMQIDGRWFLSLSL